MLATITLLEPLLFLFSVIYGLVVILASPI